MGMRLRGCCLDDVRVTDPMQLLEVPTEPRLWLWQTSSDKEAATEIAGWREARLVVHTVRGRKMRSLSDLCDEFAAALQFPWYFGENWAAFDECIKDLAWLPAEAGYVVVLTDPLLVLKDSSEDFAVLVRVLTSAVVEWATPVETGEWWDRPSVAFNVVLAADEDEVADASERWTRAGAHLAALH
jgi:Barstar (barnase inhibitor)